MSEHPGSKKFLTVRQASAALQVGIRHVLTLLYEGKLSGAYKVGSQWQIPKHAIKERQALRQAGKRVFRKPD